MKTTPIVVDKKTPAEGWLSRHARSAQTMGGFGLSLTAQRLKQTTGNTPPTAAGRVPCVGYAGGSDTNQPTYHEGTHEN